MGEIRDTRARGGIDYDNYFAFRDAIGNLEGCMGVRAFGMRNYLEQAFISDTKGELNELAFTGFLPDFHYTSSI